MRILFDQASHDMRNKGNNALLQAAMEKLRVFWPDATFEIITIAPNVCKLYFPYATPVDPINLKPFSNKFITYSRFIPKSLLWLILEFRETLWHREYFNSTQTKLIDMKYNSHKKSNGIEYVDKRIIHKPQISEETPLKPVGIDNYDLFVASGGGYLCDSDRSSLLGIFSRLESAISNNVRTVMVGQGIGPLEDPELIARAREILPLVNLIFYRNRRIGLPIMESIGVQLDRLIFTGDDAIEMAYLDRLENLGKGMGVSLRLAYYTEMSQDNIELIRGIIHQEANKRNSPLIAIPISSSPHESDITHIKQTLAGYKHTIIDWRKFISPLELIRKAGMCRIMITGTYHGAIFALAQGIPVIGVAKSSEYFTKLSELSDEFSDSCKVLSINDPQLSKKLGNSIEFAWDNADKLRLSTLSKASRMIELNQLAYLRIKQMDNWR